MLLYLVYWVVCWGGGKGDENMRDQIGWIGCGQSGRIMEEMSVPWGKNFESGRNLVPGKLLRIQKDILS